MAINLDAMNIDAVVAEYSPPPSTPDDLARYARASGDLNPLHLDLDFARKAGFDNLVVHGMLNMAHIGQLLTNNFSPENVRSFNVRFEGVVTVGQKVKYAATLKERSDLESLLLLEGIVDESGKRVISGKAVIATSSTAK